MEIRAKTISEGLESVVATLGNASEFGSQRGQTKELLCTKLSIEKPLEGEQFPFWTKEQTEWYVHNFIETPNWMEMSKELAKGKDFRGSSYCYNLRYFANDGGIGEVNSVLKALQNLKCVPKTFKEIYADLDEKGVLPDVSYSVLKYLKITSPAMWDKDIRPAMKVGASLDLPVAGFAYGDGTFLIPKETNNFEEQVINELRLDSNSRRAYTSGIYGQTDVAGRIGRPPFSSYQALIRDDKVHGLIYMRSNDMLWGAQLDIHHGILFAQKICKALDNKVEGIEVGPITLISASAHAYKTIPILEKEGLSSVELVRKSGVAGIQKWLLHVTATKPAEYYPALD